VGDPRFVRNRRLARRSRVHEVRLYKPATFLLSRTRQAQVRHAFATSCVSGFRCRTGDVLAVRSVSLEPARRLYRGKPIRISTARLATALRGDGQSSCRPGADGSSLPHLFRTQPPEARPSHFPLLSSVRTPDIQPAVEVFLFEEEK
jgi:hypothetical protein